MRGFLLILLMGASPAARAADVLTGGVLVDEVMSQSTSPHAYDWRKAAVEVEVGVDYVDEANNFDGNGWHVGAQMPFASGMMARMVLRRMYVHPSRAGELLEKTPYRQSAQVTRYEVGAGGGYALLEGRSMTRLSPWLSDFEHVLFFTGMAHYNEPNAATLPQKGDDTSRLPGQRKAKYVFAIELGLRLQIFVPKSVGFFFEMDRQAGLRGSAPGLGAWQHFSTGALWSFD